MSASDPRSSTSAGSGPGSGPGFGSPGRLRGITPTFGESDGMSDAPA